MKEFANFNEWLKALEENPHWENCRIAFGECLQPEWATDYANGEYVKYAQLCTRDGRRIGNGVIFKIEEDEKHKYAKYTIITDIGTRCVFTHSELDELFYPPQYIMADWAARELLDDGPHQRSGDISDLLVD